MRTRELLLLVLLIVLINTAVGLGQGDVIRQNRIADWIFIVACQQVMFCLLAIGLARFAAERPLTTKKKLYIITFVYIARATYEIMGWVDSTGYFG